VKESLEAKKGSMGPGEIVAIIFIIMFIIFTYMMLRGALDGVFGK